MHPTEWIDWVVRAIVALGIPGVTTKFALDWRKRRFKQRGQNVADSINEATAADKIESSSILTIQARMAALISTFDAERRIKDGTIDFQDKRITALEEDVADRDRIIAELRVTVEELRKQLDAVASRIDNLQNHDGH